MFFWFVFIFYLHNHLKYSNKKQKRWHKNQKFSTSWAMDAKVYWIWEAAWAKLHFIIKCFSVLLLWRAAMTIAIYLGLAYSFRDLVLSHDREHSWHTGRCGTGEVRVLHLHPQAAVRESDCGMGSWSIKAISSNTSQEWHTSQSFQILSLPKQSNTWTCASHSYSHMFMACTAKIIFHFICASISADALH